MSLVNFYCPNLYQIGQTATQIFDFAKPLGHNENIILSNITKLQEKLYRKKVLMICGGGSAIDISKEILGQYDTIMTMNHFFYHETLKDYPVDICMLCPEVNLDEFTKKYLSKHKPLVGFEYHGKWSNDPSIVNNFYDNDNKFFMHTKIYSILGYGVRMIIMAATLESKSIDFIGMDGAKAIIKKNHAFQSGKGILPGSVRSNYDEVFQAQYDEFWKYYLENFKTPVYNLAEDDNPYHEKIKNAFK